LSNTCYVSVALEHKKKGLASVNGDEYGSFCVDEKFLNNHQRDVVKNIALEE